jgi:hypothetical protein
MADTHVLPHENPVLRALGDKLRPHHLSPDILLPPPREAPADPAVAYEALRRWSACIYAYSYVLALSAMAVWVMVLALRQGDLEREQEAQADDLALIARDVRLSITASPEARELMLDDMAAAQGDGVR